MKKTATIILSVFLGVGLYYFINRDSSSTELAQQDQVSSTASSVSTKTTAADQKQEVTKDASAQKIAAMQKEDSKADKEAKEESDGSETIHVDYG